MKKIGLMIAMERELEFFTKFIDFEEKTELHQRLFYLGKNGKNKIVAVVSGIGKVNAALCTADLINEFKCDVIINIGISGGLTSQLEIGDFVVGCDIVYHDVWCGKPNKIGQIQDMPECFHSATELCKLIPELKHGQICCGDVFVDNLPDLQVIKEKFPNALAVDMESAAIAQTCYMYNVPLLSIRQISDTPGVEHHAEQYAAFWEKAPEHSAQVLQKLLENM